MNKQMQRVYKETQLGSVQTLLPDYAPNELKAGQVILLADKRKAVIKDNCRGMVRMIEVDEPMHDIGSSYVFDWAFAVDSAGMLHRIVMTAKQIKQAKRILIALPRVGRPD